MTYTCRYCGRKTRRAGMCAGCTRKNGWYQPPRVAVLAPWGLIYAVSPYQDEHPRVVLPFKRKKAPL